MNTFISKQYLKQLCLISVFIIGLPFAFAPSHAATSVAQKPLFIGQAAQPKVMINLTKDHQLFFKAYDDFSDLDGDDIPETTYKHSFDYYGYFDNSKCYSYSTANSRFEPQSISSDKYCNGSGSTSWSGNFLNWATMARIDVVRKVLYGGLRSTDSATDTVLERTFIPTDAHSFAKFYNGNDLQKLTPYNYSEGLTLCNTTDATTGTSQTVTANPLIRVAKGNFSLWAANERWQCRWLEDLGLTSGSSGTSGTAGTNGNIPASSGISASSLPPSKTSCGSSCDFVARVKACVSTALQGEENCKSYASSNLKPTGLLQEFGDDGNMNFGLMTGTYQKSKSGGVLRKNISSFTDEINSNGTFVGALTSGSILNTINKLRLVGYQYGSGNGLYNNAQPSGDNCAWGMASFSNGSCRNWGNPQAELLLESLRYLAAKSVSTAFTADDTTAITGLTTAAFVDPIASAESCAALNVLQFNASTTSYDNDELTLATDLGISNLNSITDAVGIGEPLSGEYFIGQISGGSGTDTNQLCTAKSVNSTTSNGLSKLLGTCPDAPRLSGSYQIAGLAHYAHTNDLRSTIANNQSVNLYGLALSPAVPKVVVKVPGSQKKITILPACRNDVTTPSSNCAIVDFKIISQDNESSPATGKLYVNWEDSEQGGDFDQDQWGIISYSVTSTQVTITTDVLSQSTPNPMGFGYVINGTTQDGFHVHSGINNFSYTDTTGVANNNLNVGNLATSRIYTIGSSSAQLLQQPLFYAAKWGGFIDSNGNKKPDLQSEWDVIDNSDGTAVPDGIPDKYFAATNPEVLESSLATALDAIALGDGAASAVATNSTQLNSGSLVYQATFNPINWSGDVEAFAVNTATGALASNWKISDLGRIPAFASRNIFTYNPNAATGSRGIPFLWNSLTCSATSPGTGATSCSGDRLVPTTQTSQQDYLNKLPPVTTSDSKGSLRVNWLRGDSTNEKFNRLDINPAHIFRKRIKVLGDIVNSDPIFVGTDDYIYDSLPGTEGSSYLTFRSSASYKARRPMLYVGANDGMLHAFDGRKNATTTDPGGNEIFAYIPNALFSGLSSLTSPTYSHQYYVDGASSAGDAYDGAAWHTLLSGTTGGGGRAIFTLDVTNPDTFGAANVLWEFTNANDADLGYTLAQTAVVRLQDGHWAVIVANGYDSDNGKAVLYVLDAFTGAVLQKINTNVGPTTLPGRPDKNGLSTPLVIDTNNDRSVDTVYAGDLYGNLWKFDLSGTAGSYPVPTSPFFVACSTTGAGTSCPTANRQPITAKPSAGNVGGIGTDQNNVGIMVYFGTGKLFEIGDNLLPSTPQTQTFYGLWDQGAAITDRSLLQGQTIDFEGFLTTGDGSLTDKPIRVVSKNPVCYAATTSGCTTASPLKQGWYMDLIVNPATVSSGERVISVPLIRRGLAVFSTAIPSSDPCGSGGQARLMEVDALQGGEPSFAAFDVNNTAAGVIGKKDYVLYNGVKHFAAGVDQQIGITKQPAVIESTVKPVDFKYSSGSTTQMGTVVDNQEGGPPCDGSDCGKTGARRTWRQMNNY